jgi:hypothetical protein
MKTCPTCHQEVKEIKQHIVAKVLEWGAVSDEEMNWKDAKKWCAEQGDGWRLPTRVELVQAFDEGMLTGDDRWFWSSTEDYNNAAYAWIVYLVTGYTSNYTKTTSYYVRCVQECVII